MAIMGPSGSGKSTFHESPRLPTRRPRRLPSPAANVAHMDKDELAPCATVPSVSSSRGFNLLPRMTLEDNVALPLVYAGIDASRGAKAQEMLSRVGLADYAASLPNRISGGQQQSGSQCPRPGQRAAPDPADEPTGNLDSHTSEEVMALFESLNDEGITVVLVTHEPTWPIMPSARCASATDASSGDDALLPGGRAVLKAMLSEAWRSMGANRLRTALTMLGMVIGVSAVVIMMAIGQGAQYSVQQSIATMGSNLFILLSGSHTTSGCAAVRRAHPRSMWRTPRLSASWRASSTSPRCIQGTRQLVYGSNNWSSSVVGTVPAYLMPARGASSAVPCLRRFRRCARRPGSPSSARPWRKISSATKIPLARPSASRAAPSPSSACWQQGPEPNGQDQDDSRQIPLHRPAQNSSGTPFARFRAHDHGAGGERRGSYAAGGGRNGLLLRQRHRLREAWRMTSICATSRRYRLGGQPPAPCPCCSGAIASVSLWWAA